MAMFRHGMAVNLSPGATNMSAQQQMLAKPVPLRRPSEKRIAQARACLGNATSTSLATMGSSLGNQAEQLLMNASLGQSRISLRL